MIQKLKSKMLILSSVFALALPAAVPLVATSTAFAADDPDLQNNLCTGSGQLQLQDSASNCAVETAGAQENLNDKIAKVINILSIIVGVVAVIMIIVGGFRYITSGGNTERVAGAKNTIMYGIIGLVIVALAQIIVKFVLQKATAE